MKRPLYAVGEEKARQAQAARAPRPLRIFSATLAVKSLPEHKEHKSRKKTREAIPGFNYKITQLLNFLDSPQIIFLLRLLVVRFGVNRQGHAECVAMGECNRLLRLMSRRIHHCLVCGHDGLDQRSG